ncbi:MAG: alpha/beta hydrolase [Kineosporiaceae bacterium]
MFTSRRARLGLAFVTAAVAAVPTTLAVGSPARAGVRHDRTSTTEAARVDRVKTPRLAWFDCSPIFGTPGAQCSTARLPLDYDRPTGAQTTVALLRIKAAKPSKKIGTLFLNPGGPGGSGVEIASAAPFFLGQDVLDRFDIVGFDPRGTNFSDHVRCWPNAGRQAKDLAGLNLAFPFTRAEKKAAVASSKAFGRACSTTGRPLSGSMSTAEVARDMDVLRRAVGDKHLSYLGFSYGTYLGQVYANMFPDRVRAVVIDGVLDPVAWAGTRATAGVPQTARLKSGEGASKALHEILLRCGKAGPDFCTLAGQGDPLVVFDDLVARAKKAPLVITVPDDPANPIVVSYADLYGILLGALYDPFFGYAFVDLVLTALATGTLPSAPPAVRAAAARAVRTERARQAKALGGNSPTAAQRKALRGFAFPYDNSPEAFQSVLCTDGRNPRDAGRWPAYAAANDEKAPGFGPLWTWLSAPCASNTWTVKDEDRYTGPFTRRTKNPVLVVGNFYDPATNYDGAVAASKLLPNSRLLSSDSFGHTAYGTSECVTRGVDSYLLSLRLPRKGTLCVGPQPFTDPLTPPAASTLRTAPSRPTTSSGASPAPIVPFVPGRVG